MANTYGTIANSGKNDFERFMEDMNKIGGYDSNRELNSGRREIAVDTKPDEPTGAGTTATANQGTVTNYGSTPSYDRQDDLLDRKERAVLYKDGMDRVTAQRNAAIQRGREDIARGDALEAQRYARNEARNAGYERSAARTLARQEAAKDRTLKRQQANADRQLAWAAQNNQASARDKELALQSRKYDAEIAALNNANKWKELETMSTLASAVSDREFRKQQLEQQKQTAAWNTVGAIFS